MPIIAKAGGGKSIPTHPDGQYGSTCLDVVDMGMVESTWQGTTKTRHRIIIRWYCGENFEAADGTVQPLWVDKWFTLSLHEHSSLRPFLESWRGRKFTEAELGGFDIETLVGAPALIQVSHNVVGDKTYANVDACIRLPKGMVAPVVPSDYVRVCNRPPKDDTKPGRAADDDGLPF